MANSNIVSQVGRSEPIEESGDGERSRNRHYESPTPIESHMADGILNWHESGSLIKYEAASKLTECVAWTFFDHVGEICRGTGLIPQLDFCHLTTAFTRKTPFTLKWD